MHTDALKAVETIQRVENADHVSAQEVADYLGVRKEDALPPLRDLVADGLLVKKFNRFAVPEGGLTTEQAEAVAPASKSSKDDVVMAALDELEKSFGKHVVIDEYDLKQAVLHRLSQIVAPDIGKVLIAISKDLEQVSN